MQKSRFLLSFFPIYFCFHPQCDTCCVEIKDVVKITLCIELKLQCLADQLIGTETVGVWEWEKKGEQYFHVCKPVTYLQILPAALSV